MHGLNGTLSMVLDGGEREMRIADVMCGKIVLSRAVARGARGAHLSFTLIIIISQSTLDRARSEGFPRF